MRFRRGLLRHTQQTCGLYCARSCAACRPGNEVSRQRRARSAPLHVANPNYLLNHMVQYTGAVLDASFAALSDATRRGVLEQLGRADASITDLAEKFHMTLTGMKKHVGVLEQGARYHREGRACADLQARPKRTGERDGVDGEVPPAVGRTLRRVGQAGRRIETEGERQWAKEKITQSTPQNTARQ